MFISLQKRVVIRFQICIFDILNTAGYDKTEAGGTL